MENERDRAIRMAKEIYQQKKAQGEDFSQGPVLADELMPDWCADVAHSPRQPVDNKPQNMCRSWQEGRVHHFVELDENGDLIRAM